MEQETITVIFVIFCLILFVGVGYWEYQKNSAFQARMKRLRPQRTSYADLITAQIVSPSKSKGAFLNGLLFITDKEFILYPEKGVDEALVSFRGDEIIGYWRPRPYHPDSWVVDGWRVKVGNNEVHIHANVDNHWVIVKLWLRQAEARKIVNRLKGLVNEDILRSYRQRPPYIYHPPSPAALMSQDLYGMWHVDHHCKLYLTPSTLVFLQDDDEIERFIWLRDIQNIRLLEQQGEGGKDGLICFDIEKDDEQIAVGVDGSDKWARSIARAARRTLADSVQRKQKDKTLLEDQWAGDVFDIEAWEAQEYVLGDDGELKPIKTP